MRNWSFSELLKCIVSTTHLKYRDDGIQWGNLRAVGYIPGQDILIKNVIIVIENSII